MAFETDHRTVLCSEQDIGEIFPRVIWHTETPILRTAPAPLFMLSELVRKNDFKVVLTGEGADEVFAGYNIFKEDRVRGFGLVSPTPNFVPCSLKGFILIFFLKQMPGPGLFLRGFSGKA